MLYCLPPYWPKARWPSRALPAHLCQQIVQRGHQFPVHQLGQVALGVGLKDVGQIAGGHEHRELLLVGRVKDRFPLEVNFRVLLLESGDEGTVLEIPYCFGQPHPAQGHRLHLLTAGGGQHDGCEEKQGEGNEKNLGFIHASSSFVKI